VNTKITLDDYRALAEFRYHIRRFICVSEQNARRAGVHPQQHRLVLAVKGLPPGQAPSIRNLANRLQIEHHSTVELVDRAARCGLVRRRRDRNDGRVMLVSATPRGERLLAELSRRNREELNTAAPALVKALRALSRARRSS